MRTLIWAIVVLIVAGGIILESRYALIVDSPVVAKIDRLTGDAWIVNSGVWRKVEMPAQDNSQERIGSSQTAAAAK